MMRRFVDNPLVAVAGFTLGSSACFCGPLLLGRAIPDVLYVMFSFSWALLSVVWAMIDARRAHRTPCYDFPFLLTLFYPVSLAWYCLWSRGWRGFAVLALLTLLWLIPSVTAAFVWVALYGDNAGIAGVPSL